ncbi:MAG: hypothetical protein PHH17_01455 [Candidatus Pacebacteria bacterium]|jgi:hypothetical protein|nr:hypothetical protein [Candidatus Paceibacterota bacterium]MDD3729163.1 hypothetical protein [Candidatus Paceibacterota bacterium]MDD4897551.1 hypothetical protein [Candidatus Paceibacterota bacterium]MDD5445860.1 hypothetical protein [Candidatus Paceibacterota bacterium]
MQNYTREQLWEIYKKLPKNIKEAMFAEETANTIRNICTRNKIAENKMPKLAELVGYVFLGLLPIEKMEKTLVSELSIDSKKAEQVFFEIQRFIILPFKNDIEEMYGMETKREKIKKDVYKEPMEFSENLEESTDPYKEPLE